MASGQGIRISSQAIWRMWASLMLSKEALLSEGKEYLVCFGLRGLHSKSKNGKGYFPAAVWRT